MVVRACSLSNGVLNNKIGDMHATTIRLFVRWFADTGIVVTRKSVVGCGIWLVLALISLEASRAEFVVSAIDPNTMFGPTWLVFGGLQAHHH